MVCLKLPSKTETPHFIALFACAQMFKKRKNIWVNTSKRFFEFTLRNSEVLRWKSFVVSVTVVFLAGVAVYMPSFFLMISKNDGHQKTEILTCIHKLEGLPGSV